MLQLSLAGRAVPAGAGSAQYLGTVSGLSISVAAVSADAPDQAACCAVGQNSTCMAWTHIQVQQLITTPDRARPAMKACKDTDQLLLLFTLISHADGLNSQQASHASHLRDKLYHVSTTDVRLSLCSMTGELPAA